VRDPSFGRGAAFAGVIAAADAKVAATPDLFTMSLTDAGRRFLNAYIYEATHERTPLNSGVLFAL
jgi:hypothetical protein